jgi:hypothetical protein
MIVIPKTGGSSGDSPFGKAHTAPRWCLKKKLLNNQELAYARVGGPRAEDGIRFQRCRLVSRKSYYGIILAVQKKIQPKRRHLDVSKNLVVGFNSNFY